MRGHLALASLLVLGACATAAVQTAEQPPCVELSWVLTGLADPESVVPSEEAGVLYVSYVAGQAEAKDGVGFISKIAADGTMIEREWVSGLNAPKGMAVANGKLYVSDIDQIVQIDTATGAIDARYDAPGAKFLNDVSVTADGTVLVSDSQNARIYALKDGAVSTWLEDPLLQAANGVKVEDGHVIVSTMEGRLLSIDPQSHAISTLAEGLGDADGVASLGEGQYLVTEWPGRLMHVGPAGETSVLMDTREDQITLNDMSMLDHDVVLIANWNKGSVSAYHISPGKPVDRAGLEQSVRTALGR